TVSGPNGPFWQRTSDEHTSGKYSQSTQGPASLGPASLSLSSPASGGGASSDESGGGPSGAGASVEAHATMEAMTSPVAVLSCRDRRFRSPRGARGSKSSVLCAGVHRMPPDGSISATALRFSQRLFHPASTLAALPGLSAASFSKAVLRLR